VIHYTNDGSDRAPALRCYLNLVTLDDMPSQSCGLRGGLDEQLAAIRAAGFEGVEFIEGGDAQRCHAHGLGMCRAIRVNQTADADRLASELVDLGHECGTVHVGWGMEDDAQAMRLIEAVLKASDRNGIPLFPEIHRATVFQDMYRTMQFVERLPEMRLNADLVHWYTGQEMVYGGFDNKLAFILPVLENIGFVHGRIGDPGCIQVAVDETGAERPSYVEHFRLMWTKCFEGFLRKAGPGDFIVFAPELLKASLYYARTISDNRGGTVEECDRWKQALFYACIASECFAEAKCNIAKTSNLKELPCNWD
jgi:hypothetical protein